MNSTLERFLRYVSIDTESEEEVSQVPSTQKQLHLAELLVKELRELGALHVHMSDHGYVSASIPATTTKQVPVLGFIAHMDTSPALSGADVKPQIITNYAGGDIVLNEKLGITMKMADFPDLKDCCGLDLVVTDGTTLLGADDKAGIAEIMSMAEFFLKNPEILHGTIQIGFTPDEEVGRGTDFFDVKDFGADVAYTVDGGPLGELEFENFNAASGKVIIHGTSIHPGSAKGKMKNALLIAMEFQNLLPVFENPMYTEGYEGFFHLDSLSGNVEQAKMDYIIRDHNREKFEQKKTLFLETAKFLNRKYGPETVEVIVKDSYYNMKEKIEPFQYLIDVAKSAMERQGITPSITPIRGGTDGAKLSYMGLPCPNLCTGGYNYHGKYEFIPVQSLNKTVDLLIEIVKMFEQRTNNK